ncbi:MAG: hypothetical protein NC079_01460 [Clostridium sp.]|nr:hypothetical protein [Acetatifactor muris]MCM1525984.1 hypothetical protein [Bacteroides sp.]MCM1562256.1 hypothetical protein [Clostridium sp.]
MKLRYYLRGLAVGIILTTLILTISGRGNRPMTDAQIRQRAMELGMVESGSATLSALQGESGNSGAVDGEPAGTDPSQAGSTEPDGESAGADASETGPEGMGSDESAESAGADVPDGQSAGAESSQAASGSADVPDGASEATDGADSSGTAGEAVVFQISSGASSYTVSRDLAAAGLVEDAADFDAFLCNNGYSKRLRTGTYEIYPGTGEEEIAEMIAH